MRYSWWLAFLEWLLCLPSIVSGALWCYFVHSWKHWHRQTHDTATHRFFCLRCAKQWQKYEVYG